MDDYPGEAEAFLTHNAKPTWAEAIKRELGSVWHREGEFGHARCDSRIRLDMTRVHEMPPDDEYVCKRCQRF
jgi:hypothetical protein